MAGETEVHGNRTDPGQQYSSPVSLAGAIREGSYSVLTSFLVLASASESEEPRKGLK